MKEAVQGLAIAGKQFLKRLARPALEFQHQGFIADHRSLPSSHRSLSPTLCPFVTAPLERCPVLVSISLMSQVERKFPKIFRAEFIHAVPTDASEPGLLAKSPPAKSQ